MPLTSARLVRNSDRDLGPATLLQSYRWIIDSRDEATGERSMIWRIRPPYRCRHLNCARLPQRTQSRSSHAQIKLLVERRT
jgi:succinate dehydrogenase / fumarate reductase iron-sulfur subunit